MNNMSSKELWNSLFDQTLANFTTKDLTFSSLEMLLLVLKSEVEKIKLAFSELQHKNEEYVKEIEEYKQKLSKSIPCSCESSSSSKILQSNESVISLGEKSPPLSEYNINKSSPNKNWCENKSNLSVQDLFSESSDTSFNLPPINDDTLFIDVSPQINLPKSPLQNKSKRNTAKTRKKKTNSLSNENRYPLLDCAVIYATPVSKSKKSLSRKLKQSKLSMHGIVSVEKEKKNYDSTRFVIHDLNDEKTCVTSGKPTFNAETSDSRKGANVKSKVSINISKENKKQHTSDSDENILESNYEKAKSNKDITQFPIHELSNDISFTSDDKSVCVTKDSNPNDETNIILNDLTNILQEEKKFKIDNSYDYIPENKRDCSYAYKREAVRKKSDRQNLEGWACEDCEKYYASIKYFSDEEIQKRKNMCSRHRSNFNPRILTPEGFWNPDFSPTQESLTFF